MYMYVCIYVQYMHYHMNTHLPSPTLAICCRYVVFHKLQLWRTLNLLLCCPVQIILNVHVYFDLSYISLVD